MWDQIEKELARVLSSKVFPELLDVTAYRNLLKPNGQPDAAFCAAAAHSVIQSKDLRDGITEFGSNGIPKVEEWKTTIVRAISPGNNRYGRWWFDEDLVQRWGRQYPPGTPGRKNKIMESIRPMLAVCKDWNGFTDLVKMAPRSSFPVITGQGRAQKIHSARDPRSKDYPNLFFIGGYRQVFVPFVSPKSVSNYLL